MADPSDILDEIFADSGSDNDISDETSLSSTTEESDDSEEFVATCSKSKSSDKPNFRSGWHKTSSYNRPPANFSGQAGPTQDFSGLSPMETFELFFCHAVWQLMVTETNRYADQSVPGNTSWTPTNVPEMRRFLALLLCMGINKRPRYAMHWSRSEVLRSPVYPSTMSRNRFDAILRFFHLANNRADETITDDDKLSKVRPLLDIVLPSFRQIYKPGRNLSPDETMIKFKGRLGFKQYMPRKAAKWGLKCFSLCESETGYCCNWQVFTGSKAKSDQFSPPLIAYATTNHPRNLSASGQVVIDLLKGLEHKGHIVFMDNWYTSPALVHKLSQLGFSSRGTVRYTSQGIPEIANPKKFPIRKGDDPQFYTKAGQLCIVWQDRKRVTLLTNYGDCSMDTKEIRCKNSSTGLREIHKPSVVQDYNRFMGGSDLAAQLWQYYAHHHRSLKWWKRVFLNILDISLLNATILFNYLPSNKKLTSLEFRVKVIEGLLRSSPAHLGNEASRLSSQHYPGRSVAGKKQNCVVCSTKAKRKQTRTMCKKCKKPMCVLPCFEKYHSL